MQANKRDNIREKETEENYNLKIKKLIMKNRIKFFGRKTMFSAKEDSFILKIFMQYGP